MLKGCACCQGEPPVLCRFELRTKTYTSLWCCVDKHPGHVWYDLWWDVHPHRDRFDRLMPDPWVPITGP